MDPSTSSSSQPVGPHPGGNYYRIEAGAVPWNASEDIDPRGVTTTSPTESSSASTSRKTSQSGLLTPVTPAQENTQNQKSEQSQTQNPTTNSIGRGMACTFCRKRKLRCSGTRPTCTNCSRYDKLCEYTSSSQGPRPGNGDPNLDSSSLFTTEPLPDLSIRSAMSSANTSKENSRKTSFSGPSLIFPLTSTPIEEHRNPLPSPFSAAPFDDPLPGLMYDVPPFTQTGSHTQTPVSVPAPAPVSISASIPDQSWTSRPPPTNYESYGNVKSHSPTEFIGQGFVDETTWWQATMNLPQDYQQEQHQNSQTQQYQQNSAQQDQPTSVPVAVIPQQDFPFAPYETSIHQSEMQPQPQPQPQQQPQPQPQPQAGPSSLAYQMPTNEYAFPQSGSYDGQYLLREVYTVPEIEGYRPGIVHEGLYPSMTPESVQAPIPLPAPVPMYDHTLDSSSYMTTQINDQQPPPSLQSQQQPYLYTFPHGEGITHNPSTPYAIPPPLPIQDPRPQNYRSTSMPMHGYTNVTPEAMHLSTPTGSHTTVSTTTTTVNLSVPETEKHASNMGVMFVQTPPDPVDRLTERLGEFLMGPRDSPSASMAELIDESRGANGGLGSGPRKRKASGKTDPPSTTMRPLGFESDGLTEKARNGLLDVFFQHHKVFMDMSIPRFMYRLSRTDDRRPGLALLNAIYMWATRMKHEPNMASMEQYFYEASVRQLDASASTGDRLIDCIRAAFLLSAFQYMNGRHHSGYLLCGHASRISKSCGLHKIPSTVLSMQTKTSPLLRNRTYLLEPPQDALELGERIHTFWAVFSLDRSSSSMTGFPSEFVDADVTTPWPRELSDIASGKVTLQDDLSVRDLYRPVYQHQNERSYLRWVKAVIILERASKLAFQEPEDSSEYTRAHRSFVHNQHPGRPPPGYLEQPKYKVPAAYAETKLGWEMLVRSCGGDGVGPIERVQMGQGEVAISPAVVLFHHICAAIETLLHDINSLDCENTEALVGARKSVALIRELPPLPIHAVDAFAPLVWVMIAKILIKEMHRLRALGDPNSEVLESEARTLIAEVDRVAVMMPTCRTYARGVEELIKPHHGYHRPQQLPQQPQQHQQHQQYQQDQQNHHNHHDHLDHQILQNQSHQPQHQEQNHQQHHPQFEQQQHQQHTQHHASQNLGMGGQDF